MNGDYAGVSLATQTRIINTQQTSDPLPIRRQIELAIVAQTYLLESGIPRMMAKGEKQILDLMEQLTLLDAIEYGLIQRVKGG